MESLMKALGYLFAAALVAGCASSGDGDEADKDLDVEMKPSNEAPAVDEDGEELTYENVVTGPKKGVTAKLPATAVIDWQAFFKPPPSKDERNVLEVRLGKWEDKDDPDALVTKGRAEVATGRYGNAETSFRKALRLKEDHPDAMLELAALFLRRRASNEAFDLLARIKERINAADDVSQTYIFRYRYTLAMAYIGRDERDKGHKVLSDLLGVDKSFAPAYVALATSYLAIGKDNIAEFVAKRGLDRTKDHAPLLNVLGVVALRARQAEAARQWFDRALEVSPAFVPALVNRAALNARNLEYAAAEQDLLAGLAVDPNHVDALVALGIVQKKQGNLSGAKAALAKAVDLAPDDPHARFNLAVLYADDLKKPNEAVRLFSEVLQTPSAAAELKQTARSYLEGLKPGTTQY
jgi:tetratricopeptide (TPR) repeat protein